MEPRVFTLKHILGPFSSFCFETGPLHLKVDQARLELDLLASPSRVQPMALIHSLGAVTEGGTAPLQRAVSAC